MGRKRNGTAAIKGNIDTNTSLCPQKKEQLMSDVRRSSKRNIKG